MHDSFTYTHKCMHHSLHHSFTYTHKCMHGGLVSVCHKLFFLHIHINACTVVWLYVAINRYFTSISQVLDMDISGDEHFCQRERDTCCQMIRQSDFQFQEEDNQEVICPRDSHVHVRQVHNQREGEESHLLQ